MEFEIPFRELGFHGVPHRSTAFVMPTVNCLVRLLALCCVNDLAARLAGHWSQNRSAIMVKTEVCGRRCVTCAVAHILLHFLQVELIEMPFTVITCADVLLVNLERVGFNLRNFDMTIVFKVPVAWKAPDSTLVSTQLHQLHG